MEIKGIDAHKVGQIVRDVSNLYYGGNVDLRTLEDRSTSRSVRTKFTLKVHSSKGPGTAKRNGRVTGANASWEAHRDVMLALFDAYPEAELRSALATYRGRGDFLANYPATAAVFAGQLGGV